jgi:dihydrofolate synthase/folylpolyglutamate synthase
MQLIDQILQDLAPQTPPQGAADTKAIQAGLNLLNNPQQAYKVIHIAGSNGKGSTTAFVEAGLLAANYKVGKFTSPYISCITECIMVNQQAISKQQLAALYLKTQKQLPGLTLELSSFEKLTLLMFVYCKEQGIDYLVLEAGCGGINDATNVVDSQFSVITNISLEHTQVLGTSLEEIAWHKAGIIKNGTTIIASNVAPLITAVKQRTSNYINVVETYQFKSKLCYNKFTTLLEFSAADEIKKRVELGLFGQFQSLNFLAAYAVLTALKINDQLIFKAARGVTWPGRLQLLRRHPRIILDAAHNPDGCKNLYLALKPWIKPQECVILAAILNDKDHDAMLEYYSQIATTIIFCSLPNLQRATAPLQLARLATGYFKQIQIISSPKLALASALRLKKKTTLISGSIYLLRHFLN